MSLIVAALLALSRPAAAPSAPYTPCGWSRIVYNAYEPDNTMTFTGAWDETGTYCIATSMAFLGWFQDGSMFASIRCDSMNCTWIVDNKQGTTENFMQAWRNMPSYLTNPDHYEEHSEW